MPRARTVVGAIAALVIAMVGTTDARGAGGADSCSAAAEAYRRKPLPPVLFELAACYEQAGELAAAMERYGDFLEKVKGLDAAERKRQQPLVDTAKKRLASLRDSVAMLSVKLPADAAGYVVKIDGKEVSPAAVRREQPVQAGHHRIEVQMPDGSVRHFENELEEGETWLVNLQSREAKHEPKDEPTPEPDEESAGADALTTSAFVVGAIGVAGVVVGIVTGALAMDRKSTVDDNCVDLACNREGKEAADEGQTLALISTIGFPVGLAGLAVGTVLGLVAAAEEEEPAATSRVRVEPLVSESMLGVRGTW